jgi:serine phosphatase RsbU (regulator of sigma subunit)
MNIGFVGIQPGNDLKKGLLAGQFPFELLRRLPDALDLPDLIVFSPKIPAALKDLKELREKSPTLWVAIVLPQAWLLEPEWQKALLTCTDKNDVWPTEYWEATFWFALQKAGEFRELHARLEEMKKENTLLRTHYDDLTASSERLVAQFERNVGLAGNIQRSLLPKRSPDIPGITLAVKYIPAAGVGGDYYDIFEFGDRKRYGFLLADSKSHGMAATLLSVLLKVRLEEMKDRFPDAKSFMEFLNTEIRNLHEKDLATLSLLYGILDRSSLNFHFCVAGSLQPTVWRAGALVDLGTVPKAPPLGGMDHFAFREQSVRLEPGDLLLLHTDGLTFPLEQAGHRLHDLLATKDPSPDPLELQNEIMGIIDAYRAQDDLPDDITLIHLSVDARALYLASSK